MGSGLAGRHTPRGSVPSSDNVAAGLLFRLRGLAPLGFAASSVVPPFAVSRLPPLPSPSLLLSSPLSPVSMLPQATSFATWAALVLFVNLSPQEPPAVMMGDVLHVLILVLSHAMP